MKIRNKEYHGYFLLTNLVVYAVQSWLGNDIHVIIDPEAPACLSDGIGVVEQTVDSKGVFFWPLQSLDWTSGLDWWTDTKNLFYAF